MSLTFIDFFAGIGGFRRGMELAGHKCVGFCEFDKFAVASYTSMHLLTEEQRKYINSIEAPLKKNGAVNFNKRQKEILKEEYKNGEWYADDIRRVDPTSMPRADVWCFGFPCHDISIAGKQKGFKGNRSSLFFAVTRLLRAVEEKNRPEYLFIENVKNLLSVNRGYDFARLLVELDEVGYDAEWEVLNSKDFGVPQNRERVFIVGHLRGRSTREVFPVEREGGGTLKEVIGGMQGCRVYDPEGISVTLGANGGDMGAKTGLYCVGNANPSGKGVNGNVYDSIGLSPTITTNKGEGAKVLVRQHMIPISMTQKSCKPVETSPTLTARGPSRGRGNNSPVPGVKCLNIKDQSGKERSQQDRIYSTDGIYSALNSQLGGRHNIAIPAPTAQDRHSVVVKEATKKGYAVATTGDSINLEQPNSKTRRGRVGKGVAQTLTTRCKQGTLDGTRIRRLTPQECFRLQGWEDEYFKRAAMVNSDSQIYKQAGNGVTVPVIEAIAKQLN